MEILFHQREYEDGATLLMPSLPALERCMLKRISSEKDRSHITRKRHYHNGFEIHIAESGHLTYEINGQILGVKAGEFLLISPLVPHVVLKEDPHAVKYAITFRTKKGGLPLPPENGYFLGTTPPAAWECIRHACEEQEKQEPFYASVIGARVSECILHLYRATGLLRAEPTPPSESEESDRFLLAKQYVEDNVCRRISVPELASYCYVSEKQLERIFAREAGMTVMEYVRKRQCEQIEKLLAAPALSLRQISETMHFHNEYHFNSFFKRYAGMSPGAYRKSVQKQ